MNLYAIDVRIGGRLLDEEEVRARYRLPGYGRDNRSIRHVMDAVRQYEETYGAHDDAEVVLRYRVNGRAEERWRWPPL